MTKITTQVENEAGIHCRPSSEILMKRQEFPSCSIKIVTDKGDADLDSILSLISLGLTKGDNVTVIADGDNEEVACKTIADLFAFHFDFPKQ